MCKKNVKRLQYYDMLKGILIITVVMGHAGLSIFGFDVFWFHMPAFFMVSGVLTNKFIDYKSKKQIQQKAKRLFVPYLSWSIVLYFIFMEDTPLKYMARVILAGRMNITTFSYPFWFVFSLFWGLLMLGSVKLIFNNKYGGATVFAVVWILIHILSLADIHFVLPWGLDCAFGAFCFLYVGDQFKQYTYQHWHAIFIIVPVLVFLIFKYYHFTYIINMASMTYNHILVDMFIPFSCFFALYHFCRLIEVIRPITMILSCLGRCSLTIYFIHAAVLHGMNGILPKEIIVCAAIALGVVVHLLFEKNKWCRYLFLQTSSLRTDSKHIRSLIK